MNALSPQASTLPTEYISVHPGFVASEPGFFLSLPGAVAELIAQSNHELEIQKQLTIMQKERDADAMQMARDEWCSKWCLPLGGLGGVVVGAILGGVVASLRK